MTLRVLVVDDEPGSGARFRSVLGGAGCESVWLERGEEALRLMERVPFDLIVTELNLDGMDGIELCRRVESRHPGIPVIILTQSPNLFAAVESFRAGAADFVSKSEPQEAILESITRVIGRAGTRGPSEGRGRGVGGEVDILCSMEEVERQHVTRVLDAVGGNKREAARILKLDRTTLYRKLKRYGIPNQRRAPVPVPAEPRMESPPEAARDRAMS